MKKVLFVGDHPYGHSGNSHMMSAFLQQIDLEKHDISIFAASDSFYNPLALKVKIIEGGKNPYDEFGASQLIQFLDRNPIFDVVCFIGLDIWSYSKVYPQLIELKKRDKFVWVSIIPYDAHFLRMDWMSLFSPIDLSFVYSEYGSRLLSKIPNLFYFRPPLYDKEKFICFSDEDRKALRRKLFHEHVNEETLIFGFIGHNQFRKDPLRAIKAFFEVKKEIPNSALYLQMDLKDRGIFNIEQYIKDCGGKLGDILVKKQNYVYSTEALVEVYNSIDCLINTSLQEGLSWTLLEAMLCGTPIIASNNTAQIELLEGGAGIGIPSSETAFLPVLAANGASTFIESRACNISSLVYAMKSMKDKKIRENLRERGMRKVKEWLEGVSDINKLLEKAYNFVPLVRKAPKKIEAVLFAQHSSAGDVFMTTRCFKDLVKRHPGIPFHYMTQKKYQDIIVGNPYIDEIIDWEEIKLNKYQVVYNPHGEKILPGHWGRNSNSILSDFYWKVLMIDEPDDFFIELKKPDLGDCIGINEIFGPIAILHTTGGDPQYRTYKYMWEIANGLRDRYYTIQVGGENDYPADADLDLRGKLSFRESAWIISKAKIAVTVDSFISHLCGALGVSQVCLFGSGNANVVKPLQTKGKLIEMSPDYIKFCKGLGPCSAGVRDCPVKCTGIHDPKAILENIKKIEEEIR